VALVKMSTPRAIKVIPRDRSTGSLVPNPSVQGVQKPNTPTGKSLPPAEKR